MNKIQPNQWLITTVKTPVIFSHGENHETRESWFLNPITRYVFHAQHAAKFEPHIQSMSDLKGSSLYRPLNAAHSLRNKKIFVERFRDRGIGDLLFLTGPFNFLQYLSAGEVQLYVYAFSERGQVYFGNPNLYGNAAMVGPTHYDDFRHYDFQWMVECATDTNEELDQLNVYDSLYSQIGLDPSSVPAKFKRPVMHLEQDTSILLDKYFFMYWERYQIDPRRTGYYVVAPTAHSPLRMARFTFWLELIEELSSRRPVIVVGNLLSGVPDMDMTVGEFRERLNAKAPFVANELGNQSLNLAFIKRLVASANCVFTLDSGLLYVAQALRTPAISVWGPHDPAVRIGYDPDYMDLAVWNSRFCQNSPCFCYGSLPYHKCPDGESQRYCHVLDSLVPDDVLSKLERVESRANTSLGTFSPAKP